MNLNDIKHFSFTDNPPEESYSFQEIRITLRFVPILPDLALNSLLLSQSDREIIKDQLLGHLFILRQPGESHLAAWLRTMSAENNLPFSGLSHPVVTRAIANDPTVAHFVWMLA